MQAQQATQKEEDTDRERKRREHSGEDSGGDKEGCGDIKRPQGSIRDCYRQRY